MLQRDLRKVANESILNFSTLSKEDTILLEVGNPNYWTIRAMELLRTASELVEGSVAYHACLRDAIKLLILTRAHLNEKDKKSKKA